MSLRDKGLFVSVLALLFFVSGCNIFEFTAGDDSTRDIIEDGKQDMRDGNYDAAFEKFDEALQSDSLNSELLYLRAKAAIRRTGVNTIGIATELAGLDLAAVQPDSLPFMDRSEWPNSRADSLYQGVILARDDLSYILRNEAEGTLDSADVQLDAVILFSIYGIMQFRDTNQDKVINDDDFDLFFFFRFGELNADSLQNLDPDQINDMIDIVNELLQEGADTLLDLLGDQGADTGLDNEALQDVIDEINDDASFYKIELGVDNDGDGRIDEEWLDGVDEDGDGLTDEDSKGPRP